MLAIALALTASASWGVSDFLAGLTGRRISPLAVVSIVQVAQMPVCLVALVVARPPAPSVAQALCGLGAGVTGLAGLLFLYWALATGAMSVVAPIAATGVALPLIVGVAGGDRLRALQAVGMVCTFVGVVLASRPAPSADAAGSAADVRASRAAVLSVLAAVGLGGYLTFAHPAARGGVIWLLVISHLPPLALAGVLAIRRSEQLAGARGYARRLLGIAAIDLSAAALYGVANRHGALSIVAVAVSLYPVATVLLARVVLSERFAGLQAAGVAAALGGVALLAAG